MRLYVYNCDSCGIFEAMLDGIPPSAVPCPTDGSASRRRFDFGGLNSRRFSSKESESRPDDGPPRRTVPGSAGIRMYPGSNVSVTAIGCSFNMGDSGAGVVREPGTTSQLTFHNNW